MDTGSTSTDNLIESLTNTLALLNQSFKAHLPQTNNQLRTSSNARNNATVKMAEVWFVQMFEVDTMRIISRKTISEEQCKRKCCSWECWRNRAHSHEKWSTNPPPKATSGFQTTFKDKNASMLMMLMNENGVYWRKTILLFLAGEHVTNFDDDVDDLALNVDHVFEDNQCDAFDSDIDRLHHTVPV
ncbi:hypothetical protein Tco_0609032 [Tanacetum coccineum]